MPERARPPRLEHAFEARYVVAEAGTLKLPCTTRTLVVRAMGIQPPPIAESYDGGERVLRYPPGTAVRVRGCVHVYPSADGSIPSLQALFPGAEWLR